jgi:gliding motility-associated-like protein
MIFTLFSNSFLRNYLRLALVTLLFYMAMPATLSANCGNINSAFTPSQSLVCGPGATAISFTNTSTGLGAAGAGYNWYLNGVFFSTTTGLAVPGTSTISAVGTYNYLLVAYDTALNCRDSATVQVIIRPLPVAAYTFAPNNQCAGTTISFTNSSTGTGGFTTYSWNFGDAGTSTAISPTHVYAAGGTYNVTLTLTNGAGCTNTVSHPVTVLPRPVATIAGDDGDGDTQYCLSPVDNTTSEVVTFFNLSTGAVSYTWNMGDGSPPFTTASTASFTHTYNTYGTFIVTMTATGANGCTTTTTLSVIFDKFVSASFAVPLAQFSGCAPHTVTPNNASQNASQYVWNFGDGTPFVTTTSFVAPSHTYVIGGSYTISVVASNSCNSSTSTVGPITVVSSPLISFTATPALGCSPQVVTFGNTTTGASPANNYYWDFGNGNTLSGVKFPPAQTYYQGTWTIMLVSGNACGNDTAFRTIVVDTIPAAIMTATPTAGCTPLTVATTNSSTGGNLSYQWFIDGVFTYTSPAIPNQVFTAPAGNTAVTHSIHLHVFNHCGVDDTTVIITVHPLVQAILAPVSSTICEGGSVTFTQSSRGDLLTYAWNFGNGNTSTSATPPAQTYATAGTYTVTLTVTGFCGASTATGTVTVNPIPVAPTVPPAVICSGTSTTLTATAPGPVYQWYNAPAAGTLLQTGASYTTPVLAATTTYYVQSTALGCTSPRTAVTVTVNPIPVAPTVLPATICAGSTATLTATAPGGTYQWYNAAAGGTLLQTGASYTTPPLIVSTTYYVQTTVGGCTGPRAAVTVTVNPIPAAPTAAPVTICTGNTATLTATAPGGTYQWYNAPAAGVLLQTGASYTTPVLAATTTYYVQTTTGGCTSPRTAVTVTVNPIPVADIISDVSSGCAGLVVHFNNNSTLGGTYAWSFAGGAPSTAAVYSPPPVTFTAPGNNMVVITVTVSGCVQKDTTFISIAPLPSPAFTLTPNAGCSPVTTVINNTSGVTAGDTYAWDFDNGSTSALQNPPSQTYTTSGVDSIYTIQLIISAANGCSDSVAHTVTVHPNPLAAFTSTNDTVCANTAITFSNASSGAATYQWTFGDAGTSAVASPAHTYATPGSYTAQLIASTGFACRDTAFALIVIDSVPVAAFSASTECLGFATQFSNASQGSIVSWSWNFGDGSPAGTASNPTHSYPANGTYNVTLTVTNAFGCTHSVTHPVIVNPVPVAAFINSTACFGQSTTFTDQTTGTPISWTWDFGDAGAVSHTQNPSHAYAAAGTYTVTLIAFGGSGCSDTISHPVTVNPVPTASFTSANVCTNDAMFFNSTSSGAPTTFVWNFGDGNSDNTNNSSPSHVYVTAGTYNAVLTAGYATGCANSITIPVTAFPLTVPGFTSSTSCLNVTTAFTDATINTPTQWSWSFGDASTATTQNPSHTYAAPGTYSVMLITQNVFGCRDSVMHNTVVNPLPVAAFVADTVCQGTASAFINQSVSSSAWGWNFGDGAPASTANSPTHTYAASGTYTVTLISSNVFGCTDTVAHSVIVRPNPVAAYTATTACFTYASVFTDNSTSAVTWSWNFGDGSAAVTIAGPSYIYPAAGTYNAALSVTNSFGCSNVITHPVTVNPVPVAAFNSTTVCFGQSTAFTDQTTGSPTGWAWDFGDASAVASTQNPTHSYTAAGTYTVTLIASGGSGCLDTVSNAVTVNPVPTGAFSFSPVCTNDTMFFNSTSPGAPDTFVWSFGDGFSDNSNDPSPTHVYITAGTYNVTLTAGYSATGCTNSITIPVTAFPLTVPAFTSTTPCLNVNTVFTDATANAPSQWTWNFGDGTAFGSTQHPTHVYAAPGTYSVTLLTQNVFGCRDSVSINTVVNPLPVAAFTMDTVCANAATSFTDQSSSVVGWTWDFGDGSAISTGNSPTHVYPSSGTYTATLIVTNTFGCTDTISHPVIVHPNPVSSYTATTACHTYATLFTDNSTAAVSWAWSYGDATAIDTAQSPSHVFVNPGNYTVALLVTNSFGCTNSSSQMVTVLPQPVADFSFSTVCARQTVQFTDLTTGVTLTSWSWDFGDGTPVNTLQNPAHIYTLGGNYNVTLIVGNSAGCADTIVKPIIVNTVPVPLFSVTDGCLGTTTAFTDLSSDVVAISAWAWDFNDGNSSASQSPGYIYINPGAYTVSLTVTNINGCDSTITQPVNIHAFPVASFTVNTVCAGNTTAFTNTSTGAPAQWSWDFGDGSANDTTQHPAHVYALPGSYTVTLVAQNAFGCRDSASVNVTVHPVPLAAFAADTVCANAGTSFIDQSSSAVSWQWDFGDGSPLNTGNSQTHVYPAAGTFNVTLIAINLYGCSDTVSHSIIVHPDPVAAYTATSACLGSATAFTGNSTAAVSWNWNFGDATANDTTQSPSHVFANAGNYTVSLQVMNAFGCSSSLAQNVTVLPQPIADFTYGSLCEQQAVQFSDATTSPSITAWSWNFGDGPVTSNLQNPSHVYALAGNYNVTLVVGNSSGCLDTIVKPVIVNSVPVPLFTANASCAGTATSFTDQSTDVVAISSWYYDFADGNTSNSQNPNYIYAAAGTYAVSLVVTNVSGCSDTVTVPVTVNVFPAANYVADTVCIGTPTNFTDISTGIPAAWTWNFGDGGSSTTGPSTTHIYPLAGSYVTSLTVSSGAGCTDQAFLIVVVRGDVHADIAAVNSACANDLVTMNDNSTVTTGFIGSSAWNFGDGSPQVSGLNTTHTYPVAGTYIITHIVTSDGGCVSTAIDTIVINPLPVAGYTAANTCQSQPALFSGNSSVLPVTWSWSFGDGGTSSLQNPSHAYGAAGSYLTTLIVTTAAGCADTSIRSLTIYPQPVASFTSTLVCWGDTTAFNSTSTTASGTITGTWWDFGDGGTSTLSTADHAFGSMNDTFSVTLAVITNYGCVDTITQAAYTYPLPVFNYGPQLSAGCDAFTTTFNETSTVSGGMIINWLWDFGDGNLIYTPSPVHTYDSAGSYYVSLTVTDTYGCTMGDTLNYPVVVYPHPIAAFSASPYEASVFAPNIQFNNESTGAAQWDWDLGDNETSIMQDPYHVYPDTGTYMVTQIAINQYGCRDTTEHPITINGETTTFIPNAFTPNGNGLNDVFAPKFYGITEYQMFIFDRWGNQIFKTSSMTEGWNGRVNGAGEEVQQDVYVYKIFTKDLLRNDHRYIGTITVVK